MEQDKIVSIFNKAGYECYMVGGCVRDMLLGLKPHDIDYTTNAHPEVVEQLFEKTIPTGKQYGTITVIMDGCSYEVTTFRKDLDYQDNRRPSAITFSETIEEDLARRDFTINAIAFNPLTQQIIDPFGGSQDLQFKLLKCVGIPAERFKEDALRIIRGIRFALKYQLTIDEETFNAMNLHMNLLLNISKERIQEEFMKIMEINVSDYQQYHYLDKLLCTMIPEFKEILDFKQETPWHEMDVLNHSYRTMVELDKPILKLAALFHDIAKPRCKVKRDDQTVDHYYGHEAMGAQMTKEILTSYKFKKADIQYVYDLIFYHQETFASGNKTFGRIMKNSGRDVEFLYDLVTFMQADKTRDTEQVRTKVDAVSQLSQVKQELDLYAKQVASNEMVYHKNQLNINGNDLQDLGITQGKNIGELLDIIEAKVIDEELKNDRECLLEFAKEYIRNK